MQLRHALLAALVAAVWGVNFTVISIGLGSFPPLLLAALRFAIAALPVFVLPRPNLPWAQLAAIAATLFLGQFALLFTSMAVGMPAGLASVVLQSQAFLTVLIAALVLRERVTLRQAGGTLVAFAGLVLIAETAGGGDVSPLGFVMCLAAALCWAVGNVLLRRAGRVDMLAAVAWLSLLPPLPLLALSLAFEGPARIGEALGAMKWEGVAALLYIAVLSTIVCFAIWGNLLKRYPASTVAPFSLLVPIFGTLSAAIVLGERFAPSRAAGMAMVLAGLLVVLAPSAHMVQRLRRGTS